MKQVIKVYQKCNFNILKLPKYSTFSQVWQCEKDCSFANVANENEPQSSIKHHVSGQTDRTLRCHNNRKEMRWKSVRKRENELKLVCGVWLKAVFLALSYSRRGGDVFVRFYYRKLHAPRSSRDFGCMFRSFKPLCHVRACKERKNELGAFLSVMIDLWLRLSSSLSCRALLKGPT